jgi:hypothetical protein
VDEHGYNVDAGKKVPNLAPNFEKAGLECILLNFNLLRMANVSAILGRVGARNTLYT